MNQSLTRQEFEVLPEFLKDSYINLLQTLVDNNLACRFEKVGHDVSIVVTVGLPTARYWVHRFGLEDFLQLE